MFLAPEIYYPAPNIEFLAPVIEFLAPQILQVLSPVIWWRKGNHTAADIYVDRNDGKGFVFLVTATSSRYEDTYELPAGVNTATWHYKAIYKDNNKQTGEISDIVSITVTRLIS